MEVAEAQQALRAVIRRMLRDAGKKLDQAAAPGGDHHEIVALAQRHKLFGLHRAEDDFAAARRKVLQQRGLVHPHVNV